MLALIWAWIAPRLFIGGIITLVTAALVGSIYGKGYADGKAYIQAKWDAAIKRDVATGNATRKKSDARVPIDAPARELCRDKRNRAPC